MKHMELNLSDAGKLQKVAHALSNELRLKILMLLDECSMNVLELSQRLEVPISTVSNSIVVLEEADLIRTERQNGVRGVAKLCSRKKDSISIRLDQFVKREVESFFYNMPIGGYSDCEITPTCGLLSRDTNIGENDNPATFYDPNRYEAQLLWFQQGFVEYRFSNQALKEHDVKCLAVSFEACSEAPNYRKDWPSDITVSINGVELGMWCCPGDFGGRQGRFTPEWWLPSSTQYGLLKRWRVDHQGSYLDDERISDVTLDDLKLTDKPYVSVRIGVKPDAVHQGGINLFGELFGDHKQAIVMRLDCVEKKNQ
ncbi:MAG: helix-turn-helix domain-containing protein [Clostridia bacterium]|nr:helix-turn-helix domain-containing protein [Clostridia bacterium]